VNVPVGATRTVEMVANVEGDWAFHCHKSHHTMNAMSHEVPNMIGVKIGGALEDRVRRYCRTTWRWAKPAWRHDAYGPSHEHAAHDGRRGPVRSRRNGGMFTVLKVRAGITSYADPGWYQYPPGTQPRKVPTPPM